eukprot:4150622-Pyramimonas_sp.AAC.1
MVNDYKMTCQSRGRGRSRPVYKVSRLSHIMEKSDVTQKGDEFQMMDIFEHEEHFLKKKFSTQEIAKKWDEAVKKFTGTDDYDTDGDNAKYPERVRVRVKTFSKDFREEKDTQRAERFGKDVKSGDAAVDTDEGVRKFAEKNGAAAASSSGKRAAPDSGSEEEGFTTPAKGKAAKTGDAEWSAGGQQGSEGAKKKGGDATLPRLRSYDSWKSELTFKAQPVLMNAVAKTTSSLEELKDVKDADEYMLVVRTRLELATIALEGYDKGVPETLPAASEPDESKTRIEHVLSRMELKPCTAPDKLVPLRAFHASTVNLKTAKNIEDLKQMEMGLNDTHVAYTELAASLTEACTELKAALKDRENAQKKAQKAEESRKKAEDRQKLRDQQKEQRAQAKALAKQQP